MSGTALLGLIVGIWVLTGASLSLIMGRRGHDPYLWLLLGIGLGPLVVPVAIDRVRQERATGSRTRAEGASEGGPVDVLVGIDGSAESEAALRSAVELFGPRLGRLTLATVIDYDLALVDEHSALGEEATGRLDRAAGTVADHLPKTVLLPGRPADGLAAYASENAYDVLAVGSRGHGLSRALLGSVATGLAHDAKVPVLITGR